MLLFCSLYDNHMFCFDASRFWEMEMAAIRILGEFSAIASFFAAAYFWLLIV